MHLVLPYWPGIVDRRWYYACDFTCMGVYLAAVLHGMVMRHEHDVQGPNKLAFVWNRMPDSTSSSEAGRWSGTWLWWAQQKHLPA